MIFTSRHIVHSHMPYYEAIKYHTLIFLNIVTNFRE